MLHDISLRAIQVQNFLEDVLNLIRDLGHHAGEQEGRKKSVTRVL